MQSINSVLIFGSLAREVNITGEGSKLKASFTLNTAKPYKNQDGEWSEIKEYVPCSVWGKSAEDMKGATIGDMIIVEGRLNTRSWETEDGERKYATEVNVSKVTVTGKGSASEEAPKAKKGEPAKSTDLSDMPF